MRLDENPSEGSRPSEPWMHLKAYEVGHAFSDEEVVTNIYFIKNVLSGKSRQDLDLLSYAREHPDFPITSTTNQSYGEYDFEAYRHLGEVNTLALLNSKVAPQATPPQNDKVASQNQSDSSLSS